VLCEPIALAATPWHCEFYYFVDPVARKHGLPLQEFETRKSDGCDCAAAGIHDCLCLAHSTELFQLLTLLCEVTPRWSTSEEEDCTWLTALHHIKYDYSEELFFRGAV